MAEYIEREAEIEIPSMRPIIEQIATQMRLETENGIVKAVQEVGFRVDKERLLKALTDAKAFYEEGYRAARSAAKVIEEPKEYAYRYDLNAGIDGKNVIEISVVVSQKQIDALEDGKELWEVLREG